MMETIPLKAGAVNSHQVFSVQLGENFLEFTLNFITRSTGNAEFGGWSLDIRREGVLLIAGAMLVPGAEITKNYDAGIGRLVFVGDDATIDNLGTANDLVFEDV